MWIASAAAPVPNTEHGTQQKGGECQSIVNWPKLETQRRLLDKTGPEENTSPKQQDKKNKIMKEQETNTMIIL